MYPAPYRRFAVSGGASTILPGLKIPCGSNVRLTVRNASYSDRAEHLLHERAADEAVAVLARQRAAVFEHEIADIVGDRLELPHAFLGLEIDDRPDVQTADRCVRIDARRRAVPLDELRETSRCSRAASRAPRPCLRRRRAISLRLSSPSTGPARLRAGSRSAPVAGRSSA